jgi:hypothetical protein
LLLSSHFTLTGCRPDDLQAAEKTESSSIDSFYSGRIWFSEFNLTLIRRRCHGKKI